MLRYALLGLTAASAGGGARPAPAFRTLAATNASANATYAPTYAPTVKPPTPVAPAGDDDAATPRPTRQPSSPRPTHALGAVPAPTREAAAPRTKTISSGADADDDKRTMYEALSIVAVIVMLVFLCCCTPLRARINYVIEVLSGAHGVGYDFQAKRQTYYRNKFEHEPLVRAPSMDESNPFKATESASDLLVV